VGKKLQQAAGVLRQPTHLLPFHLVEQTIGLCLAKERLLFLFHHVSDHTVIVGVKHDSPPLGSFIVAASSVKQKLPGHIGRPGSFWILAT
jgi:hypothetical protein